MSCSLPFGEKRCDNHRHGRPLPVLEMPKGSERQMAKRDGKKLQLALSIIHELVKIVGLLLIAQLLVYVLSFGRHETNSVYKGLRFLTSPVTKLTRLITPRMIADRHVPFVSFFIAFWAWAALLYIRIELKVEALSAGGS
jgi:hypothetical protein